MTARKPVRFPITNIPEFSDSERIIVVGIVGKSPYNCAIKAKPLNCQFAAEKCEIECSWNENQNVLYLHLSSWYDTNNLIKFVNKLGENDEKKCEGSEGVQAARKAKDFLVAAGDMTAEVAESFMLIFHLCHLIIVSSPTSVFDLSYINLFKSIDALRLEIKSAITETLQPLVSTDWSNQGRPCCPRVLFYFDSCPRQLYNVDTPKIKVFEHNMEDQIYNILRKTRIITNISTKSLMAIPKNEEFVYVNNTDITPGNELSSMVKALIMSCESPVELSDWYREDNKRGSLMQFVQTHLDLAFTSGFDDNVVKFATYSPFDVPSASTWRQVANALINLFSADNSYDFMAPLWDSLSIDTRFSQGRCTKVLPLAQAAYMENLPSHYSTQHHQQKVSVALNVFSSVARGPLTDWYRHLLEEKCEKIWESRRLCEKPSLTGNPCIKPKHSIQSDSDEVHSSGVKYIAACNCGRTKGSRDDPYTVRAANFEFYSNLGKDCQCGTTSETIKFPIFQPSINDFRAASVKSGIGNTPITPGSGPNSPTELSQSSQDEPLSNVQLTDTNIERSHNNDLSSADHFTLMAVNDAQFKDKGLVRQPSTTEYLPGMLHSESPPGLLPTFSSWSLVCLGFSSLYSHNVGLPDHLHPGFLPHLNFLVPWDCPVSRLDSSWRSNNQRGGRGGKSFSSLITVKIFFGMEYECPRGHRFMMSYCDEIITGNAFQKDAGSKLASSDMPVYCHCPCRGNKQMVAQLMRVHIVSPKTPVKITLHPKVQPTAGGPIFIPGGDQPLRLTGAAYWVLRLPYIYSSERGPLPRPTAPLAPSAKGKLLQGIIGVTD